MKRLLVVLSLMSILLAVNFAFAEDPCMMGEGPDMEHGMMGMMGGGSGMGPGMMGEHPILKKLMMKLGLDEKQKEAVKEIIRKIMRETIKKRADLNIARIDLGDLLDKDTVNMKEVESKLKQIASLQTDIRLSHIKALEEIKSKLTPDQRIKLKEMIGHHMMEGMGMMQGSGCGMMGGMIRHGGAEKWSPSGEKSEEKPASEHSHQ